MEWKLAYAHHEVCAGKTYPTAVSLRESGFDILPACVPGNFELDLMKAGVLEDLYESTNTLKAQMLEDVHLWYFTEVTITDPEQYLYFEGIDTFADIYVNGVLVRFTDNMSLSNEVYPAWKPGKNELVVHIRPTMLEARKFVSPAACNAIRVRAGPTNS